MDSRSSILRTEARAEIPSSGDLLYSQRSRPSRDDKTEQAAARASVLIIDDDEGTRETFEWALKPLGFLVRTASCAAEGIRIAKSAAFDLVLVDLKLPDMPGTDLIRTLRETGRAGARFILLSGFLTTQATVDAMKCGAIDVREKPISIEDLRAVVSSALREPLRSPTADFVSSGNGHGPAHSLEIGEPQSAVEAWVKYALKACYAETDIKTLRDWSTCAAVSYTKLRECCELLRIPPAEACRLVRVARAVIMAPLAGCAPELLLNVGDTRTRESLLAKAGFNPASAASVAEFFERQQFVSRDNAGVRPLREILRARTSRS